MGVYFNIELGHKVTIVDNSYYSKISKIEIKKNISWAITPKRLKEPQSEVHAMLNSRILVCGHTPYSILKGQYLLYNYNCCYFLFLCKVYFLNTIAIRL